MAQYCHHYRRSDKEVWTVMLWLVSLSYLHHLIWTTIAETNVSLTITALAVKTVAFIQLMYLGMIASKQDGWYIYETENNR